jgi:hypothetical protein
VATLVVCALLLAVFATLAWVAVDAKSPTYDEPLHAVGAWLHLHRGDYRVNPEDPPLWHYWAALPNGPNALNPRMDEERFRIVSDDIFREWAYVIDVLYRTEGTDGEAIVVRSRAMMLIVSVVLGAVVAWWSWRLGGFVAAVAATAAFAFDPNILGHAALVKNDLSLTLVMLLLMIAVWRAGKRLTPWNALAICVLCGAGLNIKFSALLLGPMVLMLLVGRTLLPQPWIAFGREVRTWQRKVLAAMGVCVAAAVISYVTIWATYGFRYLPTRDPNLLLNTNTIIEQLKMNELGLKGIEGKLTREQLDNWKPGLFARSLLALEEKHLLPQAWLNGLLYTQQSAVVRKTYLLGRYSMRGWWYYFPFALLVKSPVALLVALAGSIVVAALAWRREGRAIVREHGWTLAVFVVPVGVYMLSAMTSNLNIGIRHIFPIYPFLFVSIGAAAAYAWRIKPLVVKRIGVALMLLLGVETVSAFPNYIAFFNAPAGGSRNGINLLGDSNLDWGQDLKALSIWQQNHPHDDLYLSYFGIADPTYYGVTYKNIRGGFFLGPPFEPLRAPGVVAISATNLLGIYQENDLRRFYNDVRRLLKPIDVLGGGTIYLYDALDVVQLNNRLPPSLRPQPPPGQDRK